MTRVRIKNLEQYRDRHGKQRIYYRDRKSSALRVPLRGPVGSLEFWTDYHDAASGVVKVKTGYKRAKSDSIRWLVEQYYKSSAFKKINDEGRKTRRGILEKFCKSHGEKRFAQLKMKHILKILDAMADRPGAANNLLKALRQIFKYAVYYDLLEINPVINIERFKSKNKDGIHAWTEKEIEQYVDRHPIGTKAHLAFALLLHTAQRRSDVITMGRQHINKDGSMTVVQQKTKTRIEIPILRELQKAIDMSPTGDMTYLVTEYGKPFTSNGFGNWFRDRCDEAELPQCSAHGLRKAAASYLANIGCSINEIMSITGHTSISEVQRYTKAAEQKRLAENVRDRIDGQK